MAKRDLSNAIVATPNQSSAVFGVGGAQPNRLKNLFIIRFLRRPSDGGDDWRNGMSFFVKSIDRPSVQPTLEEMNQYNRKRLVHTGIKYNPINCTLYDTADSAAMCLWTQYAAYYFGDYRQTADSYKDDIINETMLDAASEGYGYTIAKSSTNEPEGINSQFFFDKIEVFQVWGGEYTLYQLLNPRISNFTPDDLDYEQNAISTISLQIQYEAIYHENGGKPMAISQNEVLNDIFGDAFSGETYDPPGSATRQTSFTSIGGIADQANNIGGILNSANLGNISNFISEIDDQTSSLGGALAKYGNFNFGNFNSLNSKLPSEISSLVGMRDATQAVFGNELSSVPELGNAIQFAAFASGDSPLDHEG